MYNIIFNKTDNIHEIYSKINVLILTTGYRSIFVGKITANSNNPRIKY